MHAPASNPFRSAASTLQQAGRILLLAVATCSTSQAASDECAQPASAGDKPVASDCLFILRAAVGASACEPTCICDPNASGTITASDALMCLRVAVGQPADLECPCSTTTTTTTLDSTTTTTLPDDFLQASAERVARLDEVLDDVEALLETGASFSDVADMLAGEPDVDGVFSNQYTLYFLVGGLSTAVHDGTAAREGEEPHEVIPPPASVLRRARANQRQQALEAAGHLSHEPIIADQAQFVLPRGIRMTGEDDDGDGKRDLPKHAIVLSPWAFDFAANDSAPVIRDLLMGTRDYQEGSVTYKENAENLTQSTMSILDYIEGWQEADIIFLSSHGNSDPNAASGPDPIVFLGIGGSKCQQIVDRMHTDIPKPATLPSGLHCASVRMGGSRSTPVFGRDTYAARAFWEQVHGGKLDKAVVYMDACRTAFHPGLAEALTGPDSVFFGWSEYVLVSTSLGAASGVFSETVQNAYPVLRSFARKCTAGACKDPPADDSTPAELMAGWHRADLRTREALNVPQVPVHGPCGVSAEFPVNVTCPSCGGGIAMSMVFDVSVEGLEARDVEFLTDPLEFGQYQLRLFADVDGMESGYAWPLTELQMTNVGGGVYAQDDLALFVNDVCPNQTIEYDPWVLLPAFDPQNSGNDARDRMYSWDGPFTIQIVPTQF